MKKLLSLATFSLLTLSGMIAAPVHAQTANGNFDVEVNLVSKCIYDSTSSTSLDFGTYTALTGGASNTAPTATIKFNCTRGLTATAAFDTGSGAGVIAGLQYNMSLGAVNRTGGTAATATVAGTADSLSYTVTGSMANNQAGSGSGGAATDARTLILTF